MKVAGHGATGTHHPSDPGEETGDILTLGFLGGPGKGLADR